MTYQRRRPTPRFSLVELLVVVSIIAILASMLLPALVRAKYTARGVVCLGNLKQIAVGVGLYTADNDDSYVPADKTGNGTPNPIGDRWQSWNIPTNVDAFDSFGQYYGGPFGDSRDATPRYESSVWLCPQGRLNYPWRPDNSGSGTHSGSKASYALYPYKQVGHRDENVRRDRAMKKAGDPFQLNLGNHANWNGKDYRVLASDICTRSGGWQGLATNHVWGGDLIKGQPGGPEVHFSYKPLYFHSYTGIAFANYAFDDGSARSYRNFSLNDVSDKFYQSNVPGSDIDKFLLPKEWAVDQ